MKNELVSVHLSDQRVAGVLAVCHNGYKSRGNIVHTNTAALCKETTRLAARVSSPLAQSGQVM